MRPLIRKSLVLVFLGATLGACRPTVLARGTATEQDAFWAALRSLCGRAYEGTLVQGSAPGDTAFANKRLVMHVRVCRENEIRIPFYADADRSRTWVVTRTANGLRLKHDHRHADGSEDAITQYGGDTRGPGSPTSQEFYADAHTAALIPAAITNVWTVEVTPGSRFAYALRREGTDRRFRVEFDLTREVSPPPPPWGALAAAFTSSTPTLSSPNCCPDSAG